MIDSAYFIDILAEQAVRIDLQRKFEQGKFLWPRFPLRDPRCMKFLIMSARSAVRGSKHGIVDENCVPTYPATTRAYELLRENGLIERDGYVPTELGWCMLERFSNDPTCFPRGYQRKLSDDGTTLKSHGQRSEGEGSSNL